MVRAKKVVARYYGIAQIAIVVAGIEAYELLRHTMTPNWAVAERHAQDVLSVERFAHIEWEEWLQRTFLRVPELVRAMNVFYFVGHFVLTGIFFFWLYHANRHGFRRFRNGFLTATFIALVVHWQFPTAPPRLAGASSRTSISARRRRRRSRIRWRPCRRCMPAGRSASARASSSMRGPFSGVRWASCIRSR